MVTGTHPEEIELFDYVEGDLPETRRAEIDAHLESCTSCAEQVTRVQAGKEVLRESQFLHLPPRSREGVFMNLPEKRREPGRSPALTPKQLLAILTPIAAVAAIAVALVSSGGNSNEKASGGAAAGATAGATTERSAEDSVAPKALATFGSVVGPADQVAAELRSKGIDARAVNGRVEVRKATRQEVDQALASRRSGRVEIVLVR
jgi:anti-sigma factor RsiW